MKLSRMHRWLLRAAIPLIIIIVWQWIASSGTLKPVILPKFTDVLIALWKVIISGEFIKHIGASFLRVIAGFCIGGSLGILFGFACGLFRSLEKTFGNFFMMLFPIPKLAFVPISLLWFGIDEASKLFIISMGAFYPIFITVSNGVRQLDKKYVELATVLQLSRGTFIRRIVLPNTYPYMISGMRISMGAAWMCIIGAELAAGVVGIGYFLQDSSTLSQTAKVMAGMISIGIVGKSMDYALRCIEKRISNWRKAYTGSL
ncbi:ABC transporter permease [Sporomusa sp. KB1]|jgi:sulfonate transport system permease protein|uniref:ABC transporter permease n=1 Tax=Sporomusa sp. KB1 TaxID=943346 RepID=UPI0011A147C2|nr:ABC transporter permease [Sporomusa sp. KB1]TWH48722.1 sulfonate transport system permease protein [Sporomusa sp. KB1]